MSNQDNYFVSRRSFAKVLATTSALGAGSLSIDSLWSSSGRNYMANLLIKALSLGEDSMPVVLQFCTELEQGYRSQTDTTHYLKVVLAGSDQEDQLSKYLVQEFMISSNFLEFRNGIHTELVLLSDEESRLKPGSKAIV